MMIVLLKFECAPDDVGPPDTHHIKRHDDHKVDADASSRGGKLPVLLHKLPVKRDKLLHGNETENHHGEHGCQNQGNLHTVNREMNKRGGEETISELGQLALLIDSPFMNS